MYYLIQKEMYRDRSFYKLVDALNRLGFEYEFVDIYHDTTSRDINLKTDRNDIFPFGSIRLARIASERGWKPGSLLNEKHDFTYYKNIYKENLLNYDSKLHEFGDTLEWREGERKFVRPSGDNKAFTGSEFTQKGWEEFVNVSLKYNKSLVLGEHTSIQVTSIKKTMQEIRLFVVDGKIITGSQYKLGDRAAYNDQLPESAIEFGNKMLELEKIADAFVLDICLFGGEWKIVEINCLNSAGFYNADVQKLLMALESHFG